MARAADRARSAGEAFLYRRLETLPETAGRFRLNVELPIPFDVRGVMEVASGEWQVTSVGLRQATPAQASGR